MATDPHIDGVVAVIPQGNRLLVIRRSRHVVAPRKFCFPGGHLDSNEPEPEGLVRELREELGVTVKPKRRVWQSVTPWQVSIAWWLCEPIREEPVPNPAEVESFQWLDRKELEQLPDLLESNHHFLTAWDHGEFSLL
ncbi:MAG TPA: NUDIX domain-containing protein [Pirellulaceae bacterium]|jgi:8-oxo-dGTP pyrophosphatase MutT (NUDIX family)|nr:NUDIX domain-containing protein [Pirellulaceae bacterium]